jgi:hypothetical protein
VEGAAALTTVSSKQPRQQKKSPRDGRQSCVRRLSRPAWLGLFLLICSLQAFGGQNPAAASSGTATSAGEQSPASQPLGHISGKVVDPSGVALGGATVKLSRDDQALNQQTQCDEDGRFLFTNVPAGPFRITVTAEGFATQTADGSLGAGENYVVPQITLAIASATTEVRVSPQTQIEIAEAQIKEQEKQRALGFVPNFYVTYIPDAVPLTPKQKFKLAARTLVDPVNFGLTAAAAGLEQATDQFNGYGQGAQGYGKRYGAAYADGVTGTMIGSALLPSLLKQDPRYFYKGTGTRRSRILYALAMSVVCKGDNGHWQPNYSGIMGSLASGGISNLYYPAKDREGATLTVENTLIGIGTTAAANILQEFVIRKLTPNLPSHQQSSGDKDKLTGQLGKFLGAFVRNGS